MELRSHLSDDGRVAVLELFGRFDSYTAPAVSDWLLNAPAAATPRLVVNLAGVEFMDSTALATLVQGMKRRRQQGGDLRLSNLQRTVRMIFELTRLDKAFEIFSAEAEAVHAFAAADGR
jgi:anti-sigma B factor antagonist